MQSTAEMQAFDEQMRIERWHKQEGPLDITEEDFEDDFDEE